MAQIGSAILWVLCLLWGSSSAALLACPTEETLWASPDDINYLICPGTDYQQGGSSLELATGVESAVECAEICAEDERCVKAVFDSVDEACHIKNMANDGSMIWDEDSRYDTIRLESYLKEGTFIATCPSEESEYTAPDNDGDTYHLCMGTDYVGPSRRTVSNVTTLEECVDICAEDDELCAKVVLDSVSNVCHVKAVEPAASLFWVTSGRFHTAYLYSPPDPATKGRWSDIIRFALIPVAAYMVPQVPESEKLLFFSSWGVDAFGGASGMTQFGGYNYVSGNKSHRQITNTQHDMFCPAISMLEDGRILVQGGSDAEAVSVYHPQNDSFTRGPDMVVARGYQTSATLSDGRIFTIGGAFSGPLEGKDGEIYDPVTDEWTMLPDADVTPMLTTDREGIWREDNHAWLFGWRNGSVFQGGPSMKQHWYGTEGNGSIVEASTRDSNEDAMCGIFVMYDAVAGKILSAGGSQDYTDSPANQRAHITTIDEPFEPVDVRRVADMAFPRGYPDAVALPDGTVLVTGGQRRSDVFTNTDGILVAELFDPVTEEWSQLAPMAVPRNYHSVAILLPDGTVFSGGGGLCWVGTIGGSSAHCDKSADHPDGEIFSPPYLFNEDGTEASRPVIENLDEHSVAVGGVLEFSISDSGPSAGSLSLVRMGSVTHSVNSDQRRVPLDDFEVVEGRYTVQLPGDSGVLIPGYYFLFAMSEGGTPSVAKTVQITL